MRGSVRRTLAAVLVLAATLVSSSTGLADIRIAPVRVERPCRPDRYENTTRECVACVSHRDRRDRCEVLLAPYGFTEACSTRKTRSRYFREAWCRDRDPAGPELPAAVRDILTDADASDPAPRPFAPPPPPRPAPDPAPTPEPGSSPAPAPASAPAEAPAPAPPAGE